MDQILLLPLIRLVAFVTTIITTRHLLESGFHFPTYLLLVHISLALGLKFVLGSNDAWEQAERDHHPSVRRLLCLFLYIATVAGALICGYQSLQHVRNTTLWMMIFTLQWESLLPVDFRSLMEKSRLGSLVEILRFSTFAMCVVLVFLSDANMSGKGEYLALGAVGCVTVARWSLKEVESRNASGWNIHGLALAGSVVPIVVILIPNEWSKSGNFSLYGHLAMLLLNLPAGAIMLYGGVVQNEAKADETELSDDEKSGIIWPCVTVCLVALVEIDNIFAQSRPTTTSVGQCAAFFIAQLSTVDIKEILIQIQLCEIPYISGLKLDGSSDTLLVPESIQDENECSILEEYEEAVDPETPEWQRLWSTLAFQSVLSTFVWLLLLHDVLMHRKFETEFAYDGSAPATLDIVIARYNEPIENVESAVESILRTTKIAGMTSTVFIYNKGSDFDVSTRFPLASKVLRRQKSNFGREGETILSHLLNGSESFADHTLFMQAEPHELSWMLARMRQYFVQETGFLSLSYPGAFCQDCDRCWDVSGWREDTSTLEDIFQQTNPGEACQGLSLTYKGQFIASRKRMERLDVHTLEEIRERLLSDEAFGYSLERLWGMIFGCPIIAPSCPTLWSGEMGSFAPGGLKDCQCLDE